MKSVSLSIFFGLLWVGLGMNVARAVADAIECPQVPAHMVPAGQFSASVQQKTMGYLSPVKNNYAPRTQKYLGRILKRLLHANLRGDNQPYPDQRYPDQRYPDQRYPDQRLKIEVLPFLDDLQAYQEQSSIFISSQWVLESHQKDELAAALAHELAHYVLAHEERLHQMQEEQKTEVDPSTYRALEAEADRYAVAFLIQARYNPYALKRAILTSEQFQKKQGQAQVETVSVSADDTANQTHDPLEIRFKKIDDVILQCFPDARFKEQSEKISNLRKWRTQREMF